MMAFCVSDDQDRQRQVFEQMGQHMPVYAIRRAMTESRVAAGDKRVRFVGAEVYEAEGGTVLRDLKKTCAKLMARRSLPLPPVDTRMPPTGMSLAGSSLV